MKFSSGATESIYMILRRIDMYANTNPSLAQTDIDQLGGISSCCIKMVDKRLSCFSVEFLS